MRETDLEALVKEARKLPHHAEGRAWTMLRMEFIRRLANALEASIERDRRLRGALDLRNAALERIGHEINTDEPPSPDLHSPVGLTAEEAWTTARNIARQALDSGADD